MVIVALVKNARTKGELELELGGQKTKKKYSCENVTLSKTLNVLAVTDSLLTKMYKLICEWKRQRRNFARISSSPFMCLSFTSHHTLSFTFVR